MPHKRSQSARRTIFIAVAILTLFLLTFGHPLSFGIYKKNLAGSESGGQGKVHERACDLSTDNQLLISPIATVNPKSSRARKFAALVGDFTVSASPSSRTITQGQTTTYTITVTSVGGFSGSVSLFALNLPGNVVLQGTGFSPQTVSVPSGGSVSSTFTYVSNNTVPTGTFTVTMRGQGGGLTRDRTVSLTINAPSFTVSASPSSRTITQGQTTTYSITVTSVNGFSGSVSLFALNLPGNVVLSGTGFSPGTVNVPSGGSASSTFTYVSNNTVPTGTFTVTMQGQGGGLTRSTTVTLTINSNTPSISSISPSSPTRSDSDQNVQVSGSNFQSGLTVTVFIPGGGSATLSGSQIQSVTSSSFTMVITLNVVGQYGIRVNNPGGQQSNTFNFNVQAANPSISSISPSSPTRGDSDQNVQVSGSNFQSGLTVTVFIPGGGTSTLSGSQIQNVSSSSFRMVITLNVVGQYGIRVNNPGGQQSNTFNFNVQVANPSISSISPSSPTRSDSDQNVQVSGSNFQSGLTVTVFIPGGGTATLSGSQIQSVNSGSFTMVITLNVVGQYGIRVNNPGGAQSNTFNFNVQNPTSPPPTVSSISPGTPQVSGSDQNVTVFGTNFQQNLTVSVTFPGGGGSTLSGTQIQNVAANSFVMRITLGAAGNWTIRVNNPDGGQSNTFNFAVQSVIQPPVVFSINPPNPFANSSDQDITVIGNNFQPNLTVTANFPSGGSSVLSGTQIQNLTPSSFILRITLSATGNWSIRVNNPDGGQSTVFGFSVSAGTQNPVISSINPAVPTTNGADQNVIVNGSNFQDGLRVDVTFPSGGISTLQGTGQIQSITASSFVMRITLNAIGNWTMRVINPNGAQSAQFSFNVQASAQPPSGLPASVLSPVIGPLRVTNTNQATADGKWEFNQHKTGYHTATGGISLSNDTFAWDANLYAPTSGNADAGKAVFAVADGVVVSYVGTPPGTGPGAVLIAHPNAQSPVWFSGYLHMANVRVSLGQAVNLATLIGEIGRVGAGNDHLHFAVYSGQNTRGNLISFNTTIIERSASSINTPTIDSIVPSSVVQSTEPQVITITGTDFHSGSIIEVQAPNGQNFTITPQPAAGVNAKARVETASSTSITAAIPFAFDGTYTLSIINRPITAVSGTNTSGSFNLSASESSFAVSDSNKVDVAPSLRRTPVIIIPGIMGSHLAKRNGNGFDEIFPATPLYDSKHIQLKDYVGYGSPIDERPIVATDIVDYYGPKDFYGTLISKLTGPYRGYRLYRTVNPNQRTFNGCDPNQRDANLFVFPYDWRSSNEQSARDLKGLIDCVKKIHDPDNTNQNFKVNIIAHSMGGLVARRYILEGLYGTFQNYDPKIDKLITLGTPWLGAPKFILALETGEVEGLSSGWLKLMHKDVVQEITRYMPGAHQLIPSRAYTDVLRDENLGDFPFGEDSWDFNKNNKLERRYGFAELEALMNRHTPDGIIKPGTNSDLFHEKRYLNRTLQDNWTGDQTGITYYNFIGRCLNNRGELNTVGSVIATYEWYKDWKGIWREKWHLAPKMSRGDCTVPEISSMRQSNNGNYLGPAIPRVFVNVEHSNLPNDPQIIAAIDCLFSGASSGTCLGESSIKQNDSQSVENQTVNTMPVYNLTILGSTMVSISDSLGNTTNPFSTSVEEGVATISTTTTGEDFLHSVIPLDQNYRVVIKTSASPLVITILKNEGQNTTLALRYLDLTIPPDVLALLEITPQGVSALKYDGNGDGTFETLVNPTISVGGISAQDIEPPVVAVNETVQSGASQISLAATDAGTGVERIMYSTNGTTFQPYTSPLLLNPAQTPIVYAFADDKVANRSGVFTYSITGTSTLPLALALEDNGQTSAALDSVLHTRDPFQAINPANLSNTSVDKNTRLVVFVTNLQLAAGEPPSSVVVNLVDAAGMGYDIPAEDVRLVPNVPLTQIIFRLPNNLASGTVALRVRAQTRLSDAATVRIGQ